MNVRGLIGELQRLDPELEVVTRVAVDEESDAPSADDLVGEYCHVTDERNVSVEYGKCVIIGDWSDA